MNHELPGRGPLENPGGQPNQNELTNQADSPKLEYRGGDIFMAGSDGGGHSPEQPAPIPIRDLGAPEQPRAASGSDVPPAPLAAGGAGTGETPPPSGTGGGGEPPITPPGGEPPEDNGHPDLPPAPESQTTGGEQPPSAEPSPTANGPEQPAADAREQLSSEEIARAQATFLRAQQERYRDMHRFDEKYKPEDGPQTYEEAVSWVKRETGGSEEEMEDEIYGWQSERRSSQPAINEKIKTLMLGDPGDPEHGIPPQSPQPDLATELTREDGLLDGGKLKPLIDFIDENFTVSSASLPTFADMMSKPGYKIPVKDATTGEIVYKPLSLKARKLVLELALEKIIGFPEKKSPEAPYNIGSWQAIGNVDEISSMAETNFPEDRALPGEKRFIRYIGTLTEMRKVAHELRRSLSQGDLFKRIIQEELKMGGLEFLQNKIAGGDKVVSLYEKYFGVKCSQLNGIMFSHADIVDVETKVREAVMEMRQNGELIKYGRILTEWEAERALQIGKILMMGLQRQAVYATQGAMPEGVANLLESGDTELGGERGVAPVKRYLLRFHSRGLGKISGKSRAFLKRLAKELEEQHPGRGSFFGIDHISWNFNGLGATDPRSSKWRMEFQDLANIKIAQPGGRTTLMELLSQRLIDIAHRGGIRGIETDKNFGLYVQDNKIQKDPNSMSALDILKSELGRDQAAVEAIMGQKLYLSSLLMYDYLPGFVKQALFRKIAILDPLKMAALRPDILVPSRHNRYGLNADELNIWKAMEQKLVLADMRRQQREKDKLYFTEREDGSLEHHLQTAAELHEEAEKLIDFSGGIPILRNPSNDTKYQILARDAQDHFLYFGEHGLTEPEEAVLKKVIDAGIQDAVIQSAAKTYMPQALMLSDCPRTAWSKEEDGVSGLMDADMTRNSIFDGEGYRKSYEEGLKPLVEEPNIGFEEKLKAFKENIEDPDGEYSAQKSSLPILQAWIRYASVYPWVSHIKEVYRALGIPTSESEEYDYQAHISLDAKGRESVYDGISAMSIVSDSRNQYDQKGRLLPSLLQQAKSETGSTKKHVALREATFIIKLLVAVFGLEFVKTMFSQEQLKELGIA